MKSILKYILVAIVGAFLGVAAATQTTVDDGIAKSVSDFTGVTVVVDPSSTLLTVGEVKN